MRHTLEDTHSLYCIWNQSMSDLFHDLTATYLAQHNCPEKKLLRLKCKLKLWLESKQTFTPIPWACRCLSYKPPHLKNRTTKETNFDLDQESITIFSLHPLSNERGEWPSGLRRCSKNRKVPGSNPTMCLAGLRDPNGPKLAMGQPNSRFFLKNQASSMYMPNFSGNMFLWKAIDNFTSHGSQIISWRAEHVKIS